MSYRDSRNGGRSVKGTALSFVILLAVIFLIAWATIGWWLDKEWNFIQGIHWELWRQYFAVNGWNPFGASPFGFVTMACIIGGIGYLWGSALSELDGKATWIRLGSTVVPVLLVIAAAITTITNIAAGSASYSERNLTIVKNSDDAPASLRQLVNSSERSNGECTYVGNNADVASCITQEDFQLGWTPRVASAKGAEIVLRRASESDNLSSLMTDSLAYMEYPSGGKWSGIRDGRKAQPIVGVVEWDGVGKVELCSFSGDYEMNKAFAGRFGKNLSNEIARRFPDNLYSDSDMWGYCKPNGSGPKEPVIVIPTRTRDGFEHVTTDRFGGLIVVTGSPSGVPVMKLVTDVSSGDYPGPVYPATIAALQRQGFEYSAGIWNNWFRGFGFETFGDVVSQSGNPSEYLLTSTVDKRRYWVTPMRPSFGESQQVVAYSVVPADEAKAGELNIHRLYVLNGDDPAVVDMQRLYNRVVDAVNQRQPAFFTGEDSSKGTLTEFLPLANNKWQIYAERGGNVVYKVEIDIDDRIAPVVQSLSAATPTTPTPGSPDQPQQANGCDAPEKLTNEQIRQCVDQLVTELGARANKQ